MEIKRLPGFLAVAILIVSLRAEAVSAEAIYKWRLAMSWPEDTPLLHSAVARFAGNVEKMSAGRMRIIIDAPGRHKAPLGVFDMVRLGA